MNAIINEFKATVSKAISKYSQQYGVEEKDVQILLSLEESDEVIYTIMKNYKKHEVVSFVRGIMFQKIDFTGKSFFVSQFIQKTLKAYAEHYESAVKDVSCMLIKFGDDVKMWLYVGTDCKEEINLKNLLE